MTEKYKIGDLMLSAVQGEIIDVAEIVSVTENYVRYRWLGLKNMPQYENEMRKTFFECDMLISCTILSCDSEQQKLAFILKYS